MALDRSTLDRLLGEQDGLVTGAQLRAVGAAKHDVERMLRRRELARVHPGVFVDHTGPLTDRQRHWAAVLHAQPAALCLDSAQEPPTGSVVHVAIEASRRVTAPPGVRIHRVHGLEAMVRWNLGPPRLRVEDNTLELAHRAATELDAIGILTAAVGSRRTTPARLHEALARRSRIRRRALVMGVLDDLDLGTCSVLEHGYLTRVERPHGLPVGQWQAPRRNEDDAAEYRDVSYAEFGLVVELDGRTGHEGWIAQGRDADRDLDDHAEGHEALRLRWKQVFGTPCRTADRLVRILARRGWAGSPRSCGGGCSAA